MENKNPMFIRIKDKVYSSAIISRFVLNGIYITFFVLEGSKPRQVDVSYKSKEDAEMEYERYCAMLLDRKELFVMNSGD